MVAVGTPAAAAATVGADTGVDGITGLGVAGIEVTGLEVTGLGVAGLEVAVRGGWGAGTGTGRPTGAGTGGADVAPSVPFRSPPVAPLSSLTSRSSRWTRCRRLSTTTNAANGSSARPQMRNAPRISYPIARLPFDRPVVRRRCSDRGSISPTFEPKTPDHPGLSR